jgi:hypothetical protein
MGIQTFKKGYGEGGFVVIKAKKLDRNKDAHFK